MNKIRDEMNLEPRYRHSVTVSFDAFAKLRRAEAVSYVLDAMQSEVGFQRPESPLSDIDRKSIKVSNFIAGPLPVEELP